MAFKRLERSKWWDWPGSAKAARMIFKLLDIKPFRMKSKNKEEMRLRGEIRAGMLEVIAYRDEPTRLALQIRTPSTYQDRGSVLLHDCECIVYVPENDGKSLVERRVEILCQNGQVDICGWGIHVTIY